MGFRECFYCPCVFIRKRENNERLILILYVDDMIYSSRSRQAIEHFESELLDTNKVRIGEISDGFAGLNLERTKEGLYLSQNKLINKLVQEYEVMKDKRVYIPMPENHKFDQSSTLLEEKTKFQSIVGSLLYVASNTRPDIAFTVNALSTRNSNATKETFRLAKRTVRYLKETENWVIKYDASQKRNEFKIEGYSDASFANDPEKNYRSTAGYIFLLNHRPFLWKTKKMKLVVTSTAEAEFVALYYTVMQACKLANMIEEMYGIDIRPVPLYCDSQTVLANLKREKDEGISIFLGTKFQRVKQSV